MDYIIVGTEHPLQKSDASDTGLRDLLRSIADTHMVVLIAEEVPTSKEIRTFGRDLIGDDRWLSIDMNEKERKDAGIYDVFRSGIGPVSHPVTGQHVRANPYHKKSDGIKETHWLNKIDRWCRDHELSAGTVVITCGHNHLNFLAEKAERRGHIVTKREYLPYNKEAVHGIFTIYDD